MVQKNVLVFVVFPSIEDYIPDFIDSINAQSNLSFDVLYFDDGLGVELAFQNEGIVKTIRSDDRLTPAEIRWELIAKAKKLAYRNIIFCDADDLMSTKRVEAALSALQEVDVFVNDLDVFDEAGARIEGLLSRSSIDFKSVNSTTLLSANFIGLSNSAFKLDAVDFDLSGVKADVFDWLFYSVLLLHDVKVKFASDPSINTKYRINENNMVGLGVPEDRNSLERLIMLKEKHYRLLKKVISGIKLELSREISTQLDFEEQDLSLLKAEISQSNEQLLNFYNLNRQVFDHCYGGWWSNIKSVKRLEGVLNGNV
jgi:hypothetical protein